MSQRDDIDALLAERKRRLHQLKLQEARYGFSTPPHVLMEIEDLEKEIARLQQKRSGLLAETQPDSGGTGTKQGQAMPSPLPDYKRKALTQRRDDLIEEYQAVEQQIRVSLDATAVIRLKRLLQQLAAEITDVEQQLGMAPSMAQMADPDPEAIKAPEGAAAPGSATLYGQGNRWAVLVGANAYKDAAHYGPLHVCVKDVEATREQLIAGGFDPARIRLLTDNTDEKPTRDDVLPVLKAVAAATEPDDLLLFYYSGHGFAEDGESYLIGYQGRHLALSDTAIAVSRVKKILQDAPARAKVLLLDACHSGASIGQKGPQPMTPEFIQRVFEQAAGMAILSSCQQGQLSHEWRLRERSVFTHFLLEALQGAADRDAKGFVTVQDANLHVTDRVRLWASNSNRVQTPTFQAAMSGDIVLTRYTHKTAEAAASSE